MKKPFLICIEGVDGSGKTTQAKILHNCLLLNGIVAKTSREPGGGSFGENLRKILLNEPNLDTISQLLLFTAARHNHLKTVINPWLTNGISVILDRFLLSTLVYQGKGCKDTIDKILQLHKNFNNNIYPDLTIVIEPSLNVIKKRLQSGLSANVIDDAIDRLIIELKKHSLSEKKIFSSKTLKDNSNNIIQRRASQLVFDFFHKNFFDNIEIVEQNLKSYKNTINLNAYKGKLATIKLESEKTIGQLHSEIVKTINSNLNLKIIPLNKI